MNGLIVGCGTLQSTIEMQGRSVTRRLNNRGNEHQNTNASLYNALWKQDTEFSECVRPSLTRLVFYRPMLDWKSSSNLLVTDIWQNISTLYIHYSFSMETFKGSHRLTRPAVAVSAVQFNEKVWSNCRYWTPAPSQAASVWKKNRCTCKLSDRSVEKFCREGVTIYMNIHPNYWICYVLCCDFIWTLNANYKGIFSKNVGQRYLTTLKCLREEEEN